MHLPAWEGARPFYMRYLYARILCDSEPVIRIHLILLTF